MSVLLDTPRYAAANAQVRALSTHLLDPMLRRQILEAPDVPTIFSLLQQAGIQAESINTGEKAQTTAIERRLRQRLARLSRLPAQLIAGRPRTLLVWYWRRFEIDNLKTVLRASHYQKPWAAVASGLIDLSPYSAIAWQSLAEAGSIGALIDRLPVDAYRHALAAAMPRYQRERSLFVLEASLDLMYGRRLAAHIAALHGRDRQEAESYLGFQLDAQNLLWAYRYRIFAQLSPEEILNYTLHRRVRVNADVVRDIALGAPLRETVRSLWGDSLPGSAALGELPDRQALSELELACRRYLAEEVRRAGRGYPLHLGALLAFLIRLEMETQDLTAIIEGRSSNWPSERIRSFLIGDWG